MKGSGIEADLLYSLLFHIFSVVIAILIAKSTFTMRAPAPYVVSLIDSATLSAPGSVREESASPAEAPVEKSTPESTHITTEPSQKISRKENDALVSDRIAALQAKKKLERMATLRKIVDIGNSRKSVSSKNPLPAVAKGSSTGAGNAAGGGDYYSLVQSKIRQQWVFPETIDRDLETVISIKIARDGKVTIDRIEKSSGNPLFDRSVVRAITNASPLPQPLHDMEIGVRFRP